MASSTSATASWSPATADTPCRLSSRRSILLPFPQLRMGWGLDVHWAALAREHGWRCGVVDAVAIVHRAAPAASAYAREEAVAEARTFLAGRPYLSAARRTARWQPTAAGERERPRPPGRGDRRVLPEPPRPGARSLGPPPGAGRAQAGAEVRVIVLHRLVPPRAALAAGPREAARSSRRCCASPASRSATGWR